MKETCKNIGHMALCFMPQMLPTMSKETKKDLKSDAWYKYKTNSKAMLIFYTIFKFEYEIRK